MRLWQLLEYLNIIQIDRYKSKNKNIWFLANKEFLRNLFSSLVFVLGTKKSRNIQSKLISVLPDGDLLKMVRIHQKNVVIRVLFLQLVNIGNLYFTHWEVCHKTLLGHNERKNCCNTLLYSSIFCYKDNEVFSHLFLTFLHVYQLCSPNELCTLISNKHSVLTAIQWNFYVKLVNWFYSKNKRKKSNLWFT